MSTVIIEQARVQLDLEQLIRAIQMLDARERQQVREALDRDWRKTTPVSCAKFAPGIKRRP